MTGRLKLIEKQLLGIDGAAFQNLCDVYLNFREKRNYSFSRTGSQFGKQKTVKGTPDTFFRSNSGKLVFVEFTTTSDNILKKLKGDIDKCLDSNFTKIALKDIGKIILFFNSRLSIVQEVEIFSYAKERSIFIELIGLDKLALDIYSEFPILSKDILGIPLETGQILPISTFIKEYNLRGGNLSTPLNNIFLNRKSELQTAKDFLQNKNLLLISGFAGVGKTKLGIEVLNNFIFENSDYTAFVIEKKDADIWEDLRIQLHPDKNYLLLIDDANRQSQNFNQILGIFKEKRKGNLKIVVTVRNYAKDEILKFLSDFDFETLILEKFTDDEIRELISSNSFKIKNPRYQEKIIVLADGNARLAIMASKLALQKQLIFLEGGTYHLYDNYFQTFIKDFDLFKNTMLLKTIGIVSFFYTLQRDDKEFIEKLLKNFDLEYTNFQESLEELHNRELVEIRDSYVRISEQIMSTYFFYKVFINDKILSFNTLIFEYFHDFTNRFKETVIHCNNTFGYNEVLNKIKPDIDRYFDSVVINDEKARQFITLFWFYKREETLSYIYSKINTEPEPENPIYVSTYENNEFSFEIDKILPLLTPFFRSYTPDSFKMALILAFEHSRKKPLAFTELIRRIKEQIGFDDDDEFSNNFQKQSELIDLLIEKCNENLPHYTEAFLGVASRFLPHHNRVYKSGRKANSFVHYNYSIPFNEIIKNIRLKIWNNLFSLYEEYPERILEIINNYKPNYGDVSSKMLQFDLRFILPFIKEKLIRRDFRNIHFVQEFVKWLDGQKLKDRKYRELKNIFIASEYEDFKIFSWSYLNGKLNFGSRLDFEKQKKKEIAASFLFSDSLEFVKLRNVIDNSLIVYKNEYQIQSSIQVILELNWNKNKDIGYELFLYFIKNFSGKIFSTPYNAMSNIVNDEIYSNKLWNFLENYKTKAILNYKLIFIELLCEEFVDENYTNKLLELLESIENQRFFSFDMLLKFEIYNPNVYEDVLKIIIQKKKQEIQIFVDHNFFKKYSEKLKHNILIIEDLYLLEFIHNKNHFDYKRDGLKEILQIDKNFIWKYISLFFDKYGHRSVTHEDQLGFIWSIFNVSFIEEIFNSFIENTYYFGLGKEGIDMFFINVTDIDKIKALEFLQNYLIKYSDNSTKVNSVISVIRHYFSDVFDDFLLLYLEHNSNVDDFSKIWWRGNGGTYHGDVNIGEIHENDWQRIYKIVESAKDQLELIPIKTRIKQEINWALQEAERERLRKFLKPNW